MKTKKTVKMWAVLLNKKVFYVREYESWAIAEVVDLKHSGYGDEGDYEIKVVPCTVTYSLPTLPKKGRGKK